MKRLRYDPTPEEAALFEQEFLSGNDRATIIVAAARLDALLGEILEKRLLPARIKKDESDQLLSTMRPLGTFSARIYMARRTGLINEQFEDALHSVRKLRNTMAHEPFAKINLGESPHRDDVMRLYECFEENDVIRFTWQEMGKPSQDNFSGLCRIMLMMLLWALTQLKKSVTTFDPKEAMTLRIKRHKRTQYPPQSRGQAGSAPS